MSLHGHHPTACFQRTSTVNWIACSRQQAPLGSSRRVQVASRVPSRKRSGTRFTVLAKAPGVSSDQADTKQSDMTMFRSSSLPQRDTDKKKKKAEDLLDGLKLNLEKTLQDAWSEQTGPSNKIQGRLDTIRVADNMKAEVIWVDDAFEAEEGIKLTEDLVVGKQLGGGVQGAIYLLNNRDGSDANEVLKVSKYKPAASVTGLPIGLKREWLIGQQLNTLANENGDIFGFMSTGAAVMSGHEDDKLQGLILSKLNGWGLEKRMWKDENFTNIDYIVTMLEQVFTALDRAWDELGFVHQDMRIANVMEHRPEGHTYLPRGFASDKERAFQLPGEDEPRRLQFKIIDYGHARLLGNRSQQKLPTAPLLEKSYRFWWEQKGDVWRLLQDMSDAIDGRTWPSDKRQKVEIVMDLIREVTGIKLNRFYAKPGSGERGGIMWQRTGGYAHNLRRIIIRVLAYLFPRRPNFSAKEALQVLKKAH